MLTYRKWFALNSQTLKNILTFFITHRPYKQFLLLPTTHYSNGKLNARDIFCFLHIIYPPLPARNCLVWFGCFLNKSRLRLGKYLQKRTVIVVILICLKLAHYSSRKHPLFIFSINSPLRIVSSLVISTLKRTHTENETMFSVMCQTTSWQRKQRVLRQTQ